MSVLPPSIVMQVGFDMVAEVAAPSSPVYPSVPVPAIVDIIPVDAVNFLIR